MYRRKGEKRAISFSLSAVHCGMEEEEEAATLRRISKAAPEGHIPCEARKYRVFHPGVQISSEAKPADLGPYVDSDTSGLQNHAHVYYESMNLEP